MRKEDEKSHYFFCIFSRATQKERESGYKNKSKKYKKAKKANFFAL